MSYRTTCVLIVTLAALLLVWAILGRPPARDSSIGGPDVWSIPEDSICAIQIQLPRLGATARFVKEKEDKWIMEEPVNGQVDPKRWGGIVSLLSGPRSMRLLSTDVFRHEEFGLDRPQMIVHLRVESGKELGVIVGDRTPDSKKVYVAVEEGVGLYTVDGLWYEVLRRLVTDPPIHPARAPDGPSFNARGQDKGSER